MSGSSPSELLLVGPLPPPINGQSSAFAMLVEGARARGIRCCVVNLAGEREGVGLSWRSLFDHARILTAFLRRAAFGRKTIYLTIGQLRAGFMRDMVLIACARLFRQRIVCHLHGGNYDGFYVAQPAWLQRLIRATLRRTDRILILGERLSAMFDFDPRLRNKLAVVPNGLPYVITPISPKELPSSSGPIRILFLSNLVESKGYFDLLEAIQLLVQDWRLNVVGHFCGLFLLNPLDDKRVKNVEQARALFEGFVREHGLQRQVAYRGLVTGADKEAELRAAHFLVLPTWYNCEGQPLSIIEAMAYGCVVIATDYRAIPDLVEDGTTGSLVPPNDPRSIAAAIGKLAAEPKRYRDLSEAALRRFQRQFTSEAHLDRILPILCEF
jgi:glycosyltransferase involved in cell wall biosynthesis